MKAASPKLNAAIGAVDWNENVKHFLADVPSVQLVEATNLRMATWARQLEEADKENPALCFVREMQSAGQQATANIALALYKSAAASMRATVEAALYYTYFRSHLVELATLVRVESYHIDKHEIVEFHKRHTENFALFQQTLGLLQRLEQWYSSMSAVVHGQVPGAWSPYKALADVKYHAGTGHLAVEAFRDGEEIIHRLFLATVGQVLWDGFSPSGKKRLLHGMHGELKATLKLDAA